MLQCCGTIRSQSRHESGRLYAQERADRYAQDASIEHQQVIDERADTRAQVLLQVVEYFRGLVGITTAAVGESVGYQSEAAFRRAFAEWMGMTPGQWRRSTREGQ